MFAIDLGPHLPELVVDFRGGSDVAAFLVSVNKVGSGRNAIGSGRRKSLSAVVLLPIPLVHLLRKVLALGDVPSASYVILFVALCGQCRELGPCRDVGASWDALFDHRGAKELVCPGSD